MEISSLSAKCAIGMLGSRSCGAGSSAKSAARESVGMMEEKLKGRKSLSFWFRGEVIFQLLRTLNYSR